MGVTIWCLALLVQKAENSQKEYDFKVARKGEFVVGGQNSTGR